MKSPEDHKRILLLTLTLCNIAVSPIRCDCVSHSGYTRVNGSLCINSQYVVQYSSILVQLTCALKCSFNQRCQAFTTADGPCQLFVFDKCSKNVRNCSCTRRDDVFVKQQPGLQPGALCPSGYGDDLCGVKYKMYEGTGLWAASRQKCSSEGGLVIMADVMDNAEMNQVEMLYTKYMTGKSFWLGGFQPPGSPEPGGGWIWIDCNIPVDSSLWHTPGQPNNGGSGENVIGRWWGDNKLSDYSETDTDPKGVFCECVSPFD